jgi:hypothetical protein
MNQNNGLRRIVLRLARNPGTESPEPDDHRGYALVAPLTDDGSLDAAAFKAAAAACQVRRFEPGREPQVGRLAHRGEHWFFDYDPEAEADDEPVYRLAGHRFVVGEYVSVAGAGGAGLTYKVTEVRPATDVA